MVARTVSATGVDIGTIFSLCTVSSPENSLTRPVSSKSHNAIYPLETAKLFLLLRRRVIRAHRALPCCVQELLRLGRGDFSGKPIEPRCERVRALVSREFRPSSLRIFAESVVGACDHVK